jgi:hypothetical protein
MLQHSPILPDSSAVLRFCRESLARYLGLSMGIYGSPLPGIPVTYPLSAAPPRPLGRGQGGE